MARDRDDEPRFLAFTDAKPEGQPALTVIRATLYEPQHHDICDCGFGFLRHFCSELSLC
jgi:hypothetical protein